MVAAQILDDYLTDEQLAQQFQKSPRTIKRWRREGKVPRSILFGNRRLTHVGDAKAYVEDLRENGPASNGLKRHRR